MRGFLEMPGGMGVLALVATSHMPTYHAHAEVDPRIPLFDAFRAYVHIGIRDFNLIEVGARNVHKELQVGGPLMQRKSISYKNTFWPIAIQEKTVRYTNGFDGYQLVSTTVERVLTGGRIPLQGTYKLCVGFVFCENMGQPRLLASVIHITLGRSSEDFDDLFYRFVGLRFFGGVYADGCLQY